MMVSLICDNSKCGKAFQRIPSRCRPDKNYCCKTCAGEAKRNETNTIILICAHCNNSFERKRKNIYGAKIHFCNINCKNEYYREQNKLKNISIDTSNAIHISNGSVP